jgi:hypothetical protein
VFSREVADTNARAALEHFQRVMREHLGALV